MLRHKRQPSNSQDLDEAPNDDDDDELPTQFEKVSFGCITRENFIRKHLIYIVRSRWFERVVILVILLNCVMLAMNDPLDSQCQSSKCKHLEKLERVVFAFFAAEMLAKMIAMGITGHKAYFSDRWNILDFLIVVAGVVDMIGPDGDFLTIIRLCRVLRPLRAINRVPSIRILVTLLMDTIPMLGNVLLLAFLVFSIFGILGVQIWQGKLRNRCFVTEALRNETLWYNRSLFYQPQSGDFLCSLPKARGMQTCEDITKECTKMGTFANTTCDSYGKNYTRCSQDGPNPYFDNMSFDNIAMAWIFIYQVVTGEGWSELMYLIQDVSHPSSWIYFVVLITIGSFFLVNLSLVVITMQFSETKRREMQLIREQRKLHVSESQISLISDFRIFWSKVRSWFSCKRRRKSVHHFHHHEHFHIHHHMIRCDKCNMFCGKTQPETTSPKEISSDNDNSIPKVEISCFDDEVESTSRLSHKLSMSCPSLFGVERALERKLSGTSVKSIHRTYIGSFQHSSLDQGTCLRSEKKMETKSYLTTQNDTAPETKLRTQSDLSNTLSITAESVSSVTVDKKQSPNHASLTTKTSLSLQVNGNATQVKGRAYCEANASIGKEGTQKKTAVFAETKANNSVTLQTPDKGALCKTYSNASYNSEVRSDDISDIADTSSEALYGSMFDLRNADKYYVSVEPTFFQKFRKHCKNLSESRKFSHFIMLFIVFNTICMGLEHHNQPEKMTKILECLNLIFIWIFGFEVCVKLLGVGPKSYFKVGYNVFDCLIVVLSVAELLISNRNGSSNVIVLRSLRLLRIFKLVRPMRHQMMVMIRTMSSVMTFFALLFLFMFTFAILGMNLFGGKFYFNGVRSRSSFDSFPSAMTTVFQILTQEDWNLVMYDGMRARNKWAALYFIALMTIGYYVLLNLLVAILVEGFTTPMEKRRMAKRIATMLLNKSNSQSYPSNMASSGFNQDLRAVSMPEIPDSPFIYNGKGGLESQWDCYLKARNKAIPKSLSLRSISSLVGVRKDYASGKLVNDKPKPGEPILVSARPRTSRSGSLNSPYYSVDANAKDVLIGKVRSTSGATEVKGCPCFKKRAEWSLYILSPENRFRQMLQAISVNKWFDYFILLLIFYSCVLLALENPNMKPDSTIQRVIDTSMFVLTWLFSVEMIIKVLAHGLAYGRDPYLRKGWNILDGFLVILSWIDFAFYLSTDNSQADVIKTLRVLRALRSLRPLRMIRRAPGLKLVVQTLLYSLKPIGNTVLIAAIFFVVFGILGVQLMKGLFYHCEGAMHVENRQQCNASSTGKWVNYQYNFDNLLQALIALFVVSTKDGWVEIMRQGTDGVDVDMQPKRDHAPWRILYFISFLLIGGFLVLNMIVGVVVENFQRCRELQGDKDNAKKALAKWRECARTKLAHESFLKNYSHKRLMLYKICTHSYWHIGITILILLNVICMAIEHYQMPTTLDDFVEASNMVFTVFYCLEAILQIVALGFKQYFCNKWYLFDFIVVVLSVLGIAIASMYISPGVVRGVRMLRVVRVLKLLKVAKGLQFLLDHVKETIPQVTNLALLFMLLFFIYSCLGRQLFGTIECTAETPCDGLGKHANFKELGSSMLTLFRIATGDNWSGILKDTLRPNCDDSSNCTKNCCMSNYAAPVFFISYVLFAQFVLVNIVIAVLMKHLRVTKLCKSNLHSRRNSVRKHSVREELKTDPSRNALTKWKLAASKRKVQRQETQERQLGYVRTKRSTDDLDNIQLKQFRNHLDEEADRSPYQKRGFINNNHERLNDDNSSDENDKRFIKARNDRTRTNINLWKRNPSFKTHVDSSPDLNENQKENEVTYRIKENISKNYALVPFVSVRGTGASNDVGCIDLNRTAETYVEADSREDASNDCSIEIPDDEEENISHCIFVVGDGNRDIYGARNSPDASKRKRKDNNSFSKSPLNRLNFDEKEDIVENLFDEKEHDLNELERSPSRCSSIYENPVYEAEECISLTGSPVLHIPDDFFANPDDEANLSNSNLNQHSPNKMSDRSRMDKLKTPKKQPKTLAIAQRSESSETCGSFELILSPHGQQKKKESEVGSEDSFAIVVSDSCQFKTSKV